MTTKPEETASESTSTSDDHYRHLRAVLREARKRADLRQEDVAERISRLLELEKPLTGAAVSAWETYVRHPPINVMEAWARVLGMRLVVSLDAASSERIPVLVRRENADLARTLDTLTPEQRAHLRDSIKLWGSSRR